MSFLEPETFVGGVYRHYKGGFYTVITIAWESTNGRERERVVVYVSHEKGTINVRREAEFHAALDYAEIAEAGLTVDAMPVWRFVHVGSSR